MAEEATTRTTPSMTFEDDTPPEKTLELPRGKILKDGKPFDFNDRDVIACAEQVIESRASGEFSTQAAVVVYAAKYLNWGTDEGHYEVAQ